MTTIETALQEGEAYLLAERLYRVTPSSQQVTAETNHPDQTVTTNTTLSLEAEIDRLMTMLKRLIATLTPTSPAESTRRPSRPKTGLTRPAALCWRCGTRRHLHSSCPQPKRQLNFRGPRKPPRPREPGTEKKRGGYRGTSVRTPRTSRPVRRLEPFTLPLTNRFSRLPETEPASEVYPDIGGELTTSPQKSPRLKRLGKPHTKRAPPRLAEAERAGGVREQPHGDSYFLRGKVAGSSITFLLDSGCTTNLLRRWVFDTPPLKERKELAPYTGEPGTLADG